MLYIYHYLNLTLSDEQSHLLTPFRFHQIQHDGSSQSSVCRQTWAPASSIEQPRCQVFREPKLHRKVPSHQAGSADAISYTRQPSDTRIVQRTCAPSPHRHMAAHMPSMPHAQQKRTALVTTSGAIPTFSPFLDAASPSPTRLDCHPRCPTQPLRNQRSAVQKHQISSG